MKNASRADSLSGLAGRPINEDLAFGIDVGVASCGWAVVDVKQQQILATGVRAFDEAKTAESRRMARGMRRNIKRSAQRLKQVRGLIRKYRVHPDPKPEALRASRGNDIDPVELSVKGLSRELAPNEAASVLLYWSGHRGFQSNSKQDRKDTDNKKLLKELDENEKKLDGRTFSQMVLAEHGSRRRNRADEFLFTPKRDWLRDEASKVIEVQRRLGVAWATPEFEEVFLRLAFEQRPLRSSAHLVGFCNFEPRHRRASRFSYSYEKFRLLQALQDRCAIRNPDGSVRCLTPTELGSATANIGSHRGLTYARLRSVLGLDRRQQFEESDEESVDIVTRGTSGCTPGCFAVRKLAGEAMWRQLTNTPELLDRAIAMISYCEDVNELHAALSSLGIGKDAVGKLMDGVEDGAFDNFSGAGNVSSKAARKLIPLMLTGNNYADACEAVGYDHARSPELDPDINSPAVKRALNEANTQVAMLIRKYGRPGHISVEMVRGKIMSSGQRERYNRKTSDRRKYRDVCRKVWKEETGSKRPSHGDVENYMLWKEQGYRCLFCDSALSMSNLRDNQFEVEHILPRSRSLDNSQNNRVLACTKCNREKRGRTPYEWFGHNEARWARFKASVENANIPSQKRTKLLTKNPAEPDDFVKRQLVDSSTVARRLLADLKKLYPEMYSAGQRIAGVKGIERISAVPGRITGMLRTSWMRTVGYEKDREDDRHHALDSMVLATISGLDLQTVLSDTYRAAEELPHIRQRRTPEFPVPWPSFADDCLAMLDSGWVACRSEDRRARGALHDATVRHRRKLQDGRWAHMEWKSVNKLQDADAKKITDEGVRFAVQNWLALPKPERTNGPKLPNGTIAKRIRVQSREKTTRQVNASHMGGKRTDRQGGFVENAGMVRADVYFVENKRYEDDGSEVDPGYYLVPVYVRDALSKHQRPPMVAIARNKRESEHPRIMRPEDFRFSLYKDSFVKLTYNGEERLGYYRQTDIADSRITVSYPNVRGRNVSEQQRFSSSRIVPGSFRKFHVDRFGKLHEVKREKWPGEAAK